MSSDPAHSTNTSTEPVIEIAGVSKAFGGRPAVIDLSLSVPRGSVFGLLGHNGAGKSTTLGMVLGQVFPDAGTLRVSGYDVFENRAEALAKVGAIFEAPAFYDYLSGLWNLRILSAYSGPTSAARISEVVELVGLTERIRHKAATYSHGMRQRLAMAQALLPGPELLILDEPADGLDPQGIHDMRAFVRRLNREFGMTVVFSSHQLHEVEQLCTHLAVMHRGRLVFNGALGDAKVDARLFTLDVDRPAEALPLLCNAGLVSANGEAHGQSKLALGDGASTAEVNRFLVERGFAVSRIAPATLSLEDFYLRLVGHEEKEEAR